MNPIENLQRQANIVTQSKEIFIPCALVAIGIYGGVVAALFATHLPLNVSISVSCTLSVIYVVLVVALVLLNIAYLKRIHEQNQEQSQQSQNEWDNSPLGKMAAENEKKAGQKQKEAELKTSDKHLQWMNDNQDQITKFIDISIMRMFQDKKRFESLPSADYVLPQNEKLPQPLPPSHMPASVMRLNYTTPTGRTFPFIAVKLKWVFQNEIERSRSSFNSTIFTTLLYLDFCFPKDGEPRFRWNLESIEGWNAKEQRVDPVPKSILGNIEKLSNLLEGGHPHLQLV